VNQDFNVDERSFVPAEYGRLNRFSGNEHRSSDLRLRWDGVDRSEREDRILIVVDRRLLLMVRLNAVKIQVPMDDDVGVPCVLVFVRVLRRREGNQPHYGPKRDGQSPERLHVSNPMRPPCLKTMTLIPRPAWLISRQIVH